MQQVPFAAELTESALDAFRRDHPEGSPPTHAESVAIATCAVLDAPGRQPADALGQATAIALTFRRPSNIPASGCFEDPVRAESSTGDIRALCAPIRTVRQGSALSTHLLQALLRVVTDDVERGRLLGSLALQDCMAGRFELASAHLHAMLMLAKRTRSVELACRMWLGSGDVATFAGNAPRMEKCMRRAARHDERLGDTRYRARLRGLQARLAGMRGDYQASLELSWEAYSLLDFEFTRPNVLGNIAEVLYRLGQFRAARAALTTVLRATTQIHVKFVTLGGYARASATLGDVAGLLWATEQARKLASGSPNNPGIAQGLLGCADGCAIAGLDDLARELYQDGMKRADAGGYHDLRFRPDPTIVRPQVPGVQSLSGNARRASSSVIELAPEGVPEELELTMT